MSSPTVFKVVSVGSYQLRLILQNNNPLVEVDNQTFTHLWFLVQHLPLLSNPRHVIEFAEISNFFWKGTQFEVISSIANYQKYYLQQVELEKKLPSDIFPYRLTDYKIFDVSVMHEPRLEAGQLSYFVYHTANGLPYRVVCPFPYIDTSTLVHYQILPIKSEAPLP